MKEHKQTLAGGFLSLNLALILISTSGVFGKTIAMAPEITIFWRCLFSVIVLGAYVYLKKLDIKLFSKHDLLIIILGGLLMAFHWVTYFYSLSLASVAIAILTLHTFPAMTTILEPILLKTKFRAYHVILALLIFIGIYIIIPEINLDNNIFLAVVFGLVSALTYALRNIYTRKVMPRYNGTAMMFFQLIIMTIVLAPFLLFKDTTGLVNDMPALMGLVILTTCLGHTLLVINLKNYSAVTISLLSSIIPIYGILWPYLFLGEIPRVSTIIGGLFILASFSIEAYASNRAN